MGIAKIFTRALLVFRAFTCLRRTCLLASETSPNKLYNVRIFPASQQISTSNQVFCSTLTIETTLRIRSQAKEAYQYIRTISEYEVRQKEANQYTDMRGVWADYLTRSNPLMNE
jgi:hypothetical protein